MKARPIGIAAAALLGWTCLISSEARADPNWEPIVDEVYLQEVGTIIPTEKPVRAAAWFDGAFYLGSDDGVQTLNGDSLKPTNGPSAAVRRMQAAGGVLWVMSDAGLHSYDGDAWAWVSDDRVAGVCEHLGEVWTIRGRELCRVVEGELIPVEHGVGPGGVVDIASYAETIYLLRPHQRFPLIVFDGLEFDPEVAIDFGQFLTPTQRAMHRQDNRLYIATDRGLGLLRGMSLTLLTGREGLCHEDVTCLADGFDGDLWIGSTGGAIRAVEGAYQFFGAERWLPSNHVNAIAVGNRRVVIATDAGLGIIDYVPFTLQKKAAYFERHLEEWGQKRLGFVHKLEWNDQEQEWVREISDNDGGWSCHYLTAMAFKYAVTGDEKARLEAVDAFNSLKWLEEITPIDGFPARAVWAKGERGHQSQHGSGGYPAEWHDTPDGVWEWKADTSSDEVDAHFFAVPIFYELVANEEEKARAVDHLARMMRHIIESGWYLKDMDGLPTRWGRWEPEYLQRPIGMYARGLNGLEILAFVTTSYALSGDEYFKQGLEQLLEWGYHKEVLRQKLVFPPGDIFHSDDRLAFYAYHPILTYEKDPYLRGLYRRSLERSWEIERIERVPWFNFIYGALTGSDCETEEAVAHLREWPLDMVNHRYRNSHRHDLQPPQGLVDFKGGVTPYADGTRGMSPREVGPARWSASWMRYDGGSGREVVDPSGWLDAYWMGRYYGMITAPNTDDPALTTVERRGLQLGARPYDGPERP